MYAGGDRPFFEDVEAAEPTVYVIHNLLTGAECDNLVRQAAGGRLVPVTRPDPLQMTVNPAPFVRTDRAVLWQGMLKGPAAKAIEERIEQVTGFPLAHYSDWTVDRLGKGSYWNPHYDVLAENTVPLATITVFLTETGGTESGGELVYPSTTTEPIKISPVRGMAVVHHNTDDRHDFEAHALHALLPVTVDNFYVARKYILPVPASRARNIALPVYAALAGGRLPTAVVLLHDTLVSHLGEERGGVYFDKAVVFTPMLLLLALLQCLGLYIHRQMKAASVKAKAAASTKKSSRKKDK